MSRSFPSRFRKRPAVGRWAAILSALCLALLAPKIARAAAPMCDPSGMSVVAPIPALPSITGELTAQKSCESPLRDEMRVGTSRHDKPLVRTPQDVPDRIVATPKTLPCTLGRLAERPEAALMALPAGHARDVYRPPRSL
jgi:hypothetical protein